jgi:hypothetical protein
VSEARFFDKEIDTQYMRKQDRDRQLISKSKKVSQRGSPIKGHKTQVEQDGTKRSVRFFTKGGRQTQDLEMYKDIDQLHRDAGLTDDNGFKTYSMRDNEEVILQEQNQRQTRSSPEQNRQQRGHGSI